MRTQSQQLKRYGLAIASTLVALLLMVLLDPHLRLSQASFLLFFGSVTLTALYAGRGPGILATLLSSVLTNYFFLEPQYSWALNSASALRMALFIVEGLLISVLVGSLYLAQEQIHKSFEKLKTTEVEVQDLNQTLQRRVDELQALFDVIPIAIALAEDPDCQKVRVNPAFSKLLRESTDETASGIALAEPERLPFKFYQNGRELTKEELPQSVAAKRGVELRDLEIDVVRGDSSVSSLYGYASPLFDEAGQPRGSVGAFVDISDRKRMETALRKLVECSRITGPVFFEALVRTVAELFQVRYAYVAEVLPDQPSRVRTIAAWVDGQPGKTIEYDLAHTPCAQVVSSTTCFYPRNVGNLFPQDPFLLDLGIESYVGTPLCALNGEVLGLLSIFHDQPLDESLNPQPILEIFAGKTAAELQREQAIADLRQSEDRYRAFVTHSAEGIWRFELEEPLLVTADEETQIDHLYQHVYLAECNQVMAEMYGYTSIEDILGSSLEDFLPRSDPRNMDHLRAFIRSGYRLKEAESFEVDRFGQLKHFANNLVGIVQDGYLVRAWGNQQDISERRQIEEALRQSEARFRLAARAVQGIVYDWDVKTGNVYRSEGLYELVGIQAEEAPSTQEWWSSLIKPEDLMRMEETFPSLLVYGDRYDYEYRVRHHDGHWVHVWDRGYLIRDSSGQLIRVVGSTADISDRKRAEQEREQLLERERAAREEAESANRVKDEFLAVLSHELRSPLNPILGWTRLLRRGNLGIEKTAYALETIERNAKLQTQLIEDLLDVSRILQGKLNLNIIPVDLTLVIEGALETVRLAAEAKAIAIQTLLDPDIQPILGDAARLQQVVWNLLSNAVKFTPTGGRVEVKLSLVEDCNSMDGQPLSIAAARYAQIQVIDTGKGIAANFLPYVFDYFRQADSTTTRRFGGLGLGLAIVRQLVELHGGTVHATSPGEEQGTTFTVRLPIAKETSVRLDRISPSLRSTNFQMKPLRNLRVLLVDDEADARDLIRFVLEESGAAVTITSSAAEALKAFPQLKPDLVVSDIGMPDMDGYRLMRQIRQMPPEQGGQVPAIALTAYAGEMNQKRAIAAGFQHHLAKPVEINELVEVVLSLIHQPAYQDG